MQATTLAAKRPAVTARVATLTNQRRSQQSPEYSGEATPQERSLMTPDGSRLTDGAAEPTVALIEGGEQLEEADHLRSWLTRLSTTGGDHR